MPRQTNLDFFQYSAKPSACASALVAVVIARATADLFKDVP